MYIELWYLYCVSNILQRIETVNKMWWYKLLFLKLPRHRKWSFLWRISSVNVTKSAGNCWICLNYLKNLTWKTSFFCAGYIFESKIKFFIRRKTKMFIAAFGLALCSSFFFLFIFQCFCFTCFLLLFNVFCTSPPNQ